MRVLIKGAGDLATGVAIKLKNCGFEVIMTEINFPTTVRRTVAFSSAIFDDCITVENITARLVKSYENIEKTLKNNEIPIIIDEKCDYLTLIKPEVVVDAILAKKNINTTKNQAKIVIALGPGFNAGIDCHSVIETNRGHNLGRCIYTGFAEKNTGVPGFINGFSSERILRANNDGIVSHSVKIGDLVKKNQEIATIEGVSVTAEIDGMIRGLIQSGCTVKKGLKIGDIDPRGDFACYTTVSDKARAIAGGVLESILVLNGGINE